MTTTSLAQTTILIVDDTVNNLRVLSQVLAELGGEILVADEGELALEQAAYAQPDLILLDVMMPGLDGYEICERLKANPRTQTIPVIFMTSLDNTVDKLKCFALGSVDYVSKPFHPEEVKARVKVHLERQQISKSLEYQNIVLKRTNDILIREIEERQKIEIALQASEAKLNKILNSTIAAIVNFRVYENLDFVYDYYSPSSHIIFGYSPQELLADKYLWISRVLPEDVNNVIMPSFEAMFNEATVFNEYRFRHKDGSLSWIASTQHSRRDEAQNCWVVTCVEMDVTKLKQTEKALQTSEEKFRLATEYGQIAVWDWNAQTGEVYWSELKFQHLGYIPGEIEPSYQAWLNRIHPDDQERVTMTQSLVERAKSDTELDIEYRIILPDGKIRWLVDKGRSICDEAGNLVRMTGIMMDVTERKQAELSLQESQRHYETLAEMSPVGIFRTDLVGNCRYVNPKWCQLAGLTPEEAFGAGWVSALHPEDQEKTTTQWYHSAQEQIPFFCETRFCTPEGVVTWLVAQAKAETNENGSITGYVGTITDITDRKIAEEQLQQAHSSLQAIFNAFPDLFFQLDAQGQIIDYRAGEQPQDLSVSPTVFRDKTIYEMLPLTVAELIHQAVEQTLQTQKIVSLEYSLSIEQAEQFYEARLVPCQQNQVIAIVRNITERKNLENKLLTSQAFLQNIYQGTDLPIYVMKVSEDGQLRYFDFNPAWERTTRLNVDFLLGKTLDEIIYFLAPETPDNFAIYYQNCLQTGERIQGEEKIICQGQETWWISTLSPLKNQDGQVEYIVATSLPITERKQAELALQNENAFRTQIIEQMAEGLCVCYETSDFPYVQFTVWNHRMTEITGYTREEINQLGWYQSLYREPDMREQAIARMSRMRQGDNLKAEEWEITRSDGNKRIISITTSIIETNEGIPYVMALMQDVTERKQAELALRISEERYALATRAARVGVWDWNLESGEFFLDPSVKAILGYKDEEIPNNLDSWITYVYPEDHQQVMELAQAHINGETPEYVCEHRMMHKNGSLRWILVRGNIIRDEQGRGIRFVGTDTDITERKKVEMALQASELNLSQTINAVPGAVYQFCLKPSGEMSFPYASQGWQTLYEIPHEIVIQDINQVWKLIHPDDLESLEESIRISAKNLTLWTSEHRIITPSGRPKWISASSLPTRLQDGTIVWHGIILDNTERHQLEEKLRRSELQVRQITNAIPGAVYQYHLDLDFQDSFPFLSQGWSELFEVSNEDTQADPLTTWQLIHPDDVPRLRESILYSATHLTPWSGEYRITTPSGRQKWLSGQSIPSRQDDGSILWNGIMLDITERKELEAALQKLNEELEHRVRERTQELQRQTQLLQTILNSMGDGVIVADCHAHLILYNPSAERILGISLAQTCPDSTDYSEMFLADGITRCSLEDSPMTQAIRGYSADNLERLIRNSYHPNGIYVEAAVRPLRDDTGQLQGGVVVFRDITERKVAEAKRQQTEEALRQSEERFRQANLDLESRVIQRTAELQHAKEAAEAASKAKSVFLANMSHELRTPLNAILGFSQLMSRDSSLGQIQKEYLSIINRSGEHLLNLINDILEMSKIEAGQIVLNPQNFALHDLLDTLEKMFKLRANKKHLNLSVEIAPSVPHFINTDENKLRQVLINLLGNAVKFTQQGQIILRVQQATEQCDHLNSSQVLLQFEVKDSGVGIPSDKIQSIFDPFIQATNEPKIQEGTGLGLPISQQFVKLLGGDLNVISELEQGSTFFFTIPVLVAMNKELAVTANRRQVRGLAPEQSVYRILIVEDQETNRQLLLKVLEPLGFEIREAVDGLEAIEIWETWQPHLIWMDIRMPVINGYDATRQIRERERQSTKTEKIPCKIIALTASAFTQDRDNILAAGCDDFMPKPFQESMLLEKMAQHLGLKYIYEPTDASAAQAIFYRLTPNALKIMPLEWINQLYQTAIQLNTHRMLALIAKIPPEHSDLAERLKAKVHSYDFEDIMEVAQQALES